MKKNSVLSFAGGVQVEPGVRAARRMFLRWAQGEVGAVITGIEERLGLVEDDLQEWLDQAENLSGVNEPQKVRKILDGVIGDLSAIRAGGSASEICDELYDVASELDEAVKSLRFPRRKRARRGRRASYQGTLD